MGQRHALQNDQPVEAKIYNYELFIPHTKSTFYRDKVQVCPQYIPGKQNLKADKTIRDIHRAKANAIKWTNPPSYWHVKYREIIEWTKHNREITAKE